MAYDFFENTSSDSATTLTINGPTVELPDASYIRDAAIERDGVDLVLDGPHGTITVEGYFAAETSPDLTADGGLVLTPGLVNSFVSSGDRYASTETMNDASPVGAVDEVSGDATITRTDGSVETITMGTPVYQGDVIETSGQGAVNISFIDETNFAVSNNARLAIDEYVFDPATEAGSQNFSVLKGVFVFTSGLIGRDDPDDVNIDMPSGSIGIRGTIIAGDADTGEVTVVEGAIVVRDNNDNELTLDDRFETAKIDLELGEIRNLGQLDANDVSNRFDTVSNVSPTLFSSIEDAAAEEVINPDNSGENAEDVNEPAPTEENFDADGTVDGDGDSDVDGTVEEGTAGDETGALDTPPASDNLLEETQKTELDSKEVIQNKLGNDGLGDDNVTLKAELKESVENGDMTEAEAKEVLAKSSTMTTEQNVALKNFLQDAQDPDTIEPVLSSQANLRPEVDQAEPNSFFKAGEGNSFVYNFADDFRDPEGQTLTFNIENVAGPGTANVTVGGFTGGFLGFDVSALPNDLFITFDIRATDPGGQSSVNSYTLNLMDPDGGTFVNDAGSTIIGSTVDIAFTGTTPTIGQGGLLDVRTISLTNGGENATLVNVTNALIYLGEGSNSLTIEQNATNNDFNSIFGGSTNDTITFAFPTFGTTNHFQNDVFTGSGNDRIVLQAQGDMAFTGLNIRAGSGNDLLDLSTPTGAIFNFANVDGLFDGVTYNAGNITSTTINDIEQIDLGTGSGAVALSLSAQNVLDFTDGDNVLRIVGDSTDEVDLFSMVASGSSGAFDRYVGNVFGEQVTLLVDQNITNVTVN